MLFYILLYIIIYECVESLSIKTSFIASPSIRTRDSALKSYKLQTHVQKRIANQKLYNRDGITLRLPYYKNPRERYIKILEQTDNVDYTTVENLLQRVKDESTYKDFSKIKSTFLEIVKWMCFKRKDITSHKLFNDFRTNVLSNSSMFGAVYSRFLNSLLKSAKVYPGLGLRNGIKHYVEYRSGKFSDYLSLEELLNTTLPIFSVHDDFYNRLISLCNDNNTLDVLESVFKDSKPKTKSSFKDLNGFNNNFMRSHWGYLAFFAFRHSPRSTVELITKISEPKDIQNFDYLKTGEDNIQLAESHQETILNSFSHVYKIFKLVEEASEVERKEKGVDPLQKVGILVLQIRPTEDELAAIYFILKHKLSAASLEDIFCNFLEFVDYLNRRIQSKDCDYGYLKFLIQSVSKEYMMSIMKYCVNYHGKLKLIYKEITKEIGPMDQIKISNNSKEILTKIGMENFLKFLNVEYQEPKSDEDLIFGILKDSGSIFIYDFQKEKIVWGNNKEEMDLRNFKGNCLDKITFCHFIIFSESDDVEKVIKDNTDFIRENYLKKINIETAHSFVSLDLPYFKQNPPQPFDIYALKQGKIVTHPINPKLHIISYDWKTQ